MEKNNNIGTWLHGIGATEDLDSSGERIKIKGIDISSITNDGTFNYEHKAEEPNQTVGKVLEAKRILTKEDCTNEHHEFFWKKAGEKPYLYIAGVLFDKCGHNGAINIAAMLNFDTLTDKDQTKHVINFSIEGSRLDKKGIWINKCIARKMTITHQACNKRCVAELLENPENTKIISQESLFDIFKKYEVMETDLKKSILPKTKMFGEKDKPTVSPKYHSKLSFKTKETKPSAKETFKPISATTGQHREGTAIKPKRTMTSQDAKVGDNFKVGDRVTHQTKKPRTGKDIYNDPNTWKSEGKKKDMGRLIKRSDIQRRIKEKKSYMSNVQKALVASCGMGAPSTRSGGAALSKEQLNKVFKSASNSAFDRFDKKEDLVKFLSDKLPNLKSNEVKAIAKAVAYMSEKRREDKLAGMASKDLDKSGKGVVGTSRRLNRLVSQGIKETTGEKRGRDKNVKEREKEAKLQHYKNKIENPGKKRKFDTNKPKKKKDKKVGNTVTMEMDLAASEKDVVK